MPAPKETAILTVAAVRTPRENGATEVLFNERQQIFLLPSSARSRSTTERRLHEALERDAPIRAVLNPRRGTLAQVQPVPSEEVEDFKHTRTSLEDPDKAHRIEVSTIDPTTFNIVDHYLKVPAFRLCARIMPSYRVAREIFDLCAAQSCNLPGPPAISPCIPFQYVVDGCYARAHKMRQIIEDRYGYCCEKVFSFANQNYDALAVRANKWGGCCVTWWYHVAPLVRVRVRLRLGPINLQFVLAMVIDPGMFDKPVLLSSWLMAQQDAACSANAHVSMYAIEPGSAYTPADYAGTAFTTDPTYAQTDATLTAYANLTTC